MGYAYQPRFRIHPASGGDTIYLLTQSAVDVGGALTGKFPSSIVVTYSPEKVSAMTPERALVEKRWGWRPIVEMSWNILALANESFLADLATAFGDDTKQVFLSLDGGTTEREIVFDGDYKRAPLSGKAPMGIETSMTFKCVNVIATVPTIGAGAW